MFSSFHPKQRALLERDSKKAGYYWAVCMNKARKRVIHCAWEEAQNSYCLALDAAKIMLDAKHSEQGASDEFSENRYVQTAIEAVYSYLSAGEKAVAYAVAKNATDYLCTIDLSQARDPLVCSIIDCLETEDSEVEHWIANNLVAPFAKRQVLH